MSEIKVADMKGLEVRGDGPGHLSNNFTEFQQSHYGQYGDPLFAEFGPSTDICGNFNSACAQRTNAFRKIGCHHLALQYKTCFMSKNKNYDGSATLKLIGQD